MSRLGRRTLHILPLRPLLLRSLAELPRLPCLGFRADNLSNLKVLLMVAEEVLPMLDLLAHARGSQPTVLLTADLHLAAAQGLQLVGIIDGDEHFLDAAQVGRQVLLEAAGDKGAGGILAREEAVVAARAVDERVGGDIEDGAVDGEVDRKGGIGAVVDGELVGGKEERALLFVWIVG